MSEPSFGFLAGSHAINSFRKSGYKNVAYALGELVDNSIQEDAFAVDILIAEEQVPSASKKLVWRVQEIGVLDNGKGMDDDRLRRSLRLGDGDAQQGNSRGKDSNQMGKFGVGLPQASISQCKKVDIWSWTDGGHRTAKWISIDLDDKVWIEEELLEIPKPVPKSIPKKWLNGSSIWENSGTLIVWSKLDRCAWRTSTAIKNNSEFLIGRMYRRHISSGDVVIRLAAFENSKPYRMRSTDRNRDGTIDPDEYHEWIFKPNDPLYLDSNADSGDPPRNPQFDQAGEPQIMSFTFPDEETGEMMTSDIRLTFSKACVEVRKGHGFDPDVHPQAIGGSQPHGLHARKNMGLSIVREGRELELDDGWCTTERNAAYERWWGAQIDFDRGMDHIFEVTNNKQHAHNLSEVAKKNWSYWKEADDETTQDIKVRLREDDFPMYVCMIVAEEIRENLGIIRRQIFAENPTKRAKTKKRRHDAEAQATAAINKRKEQGLEGASDSAAAMSDDETRKALEKALELAGLSEDQIEDMDLGGTVINRYKVLYAQRSMDSDAFFSVEKQVGKLIIYLNTNHKAYRYLIGAIDDIENDEELDEDQLRSKAHEAAKAVKMLLSAWARHEDEAKGDELNAIMRFRRDWGRMSEDFLMNPGEVETDWTS